MQNKLDKYYSHLKEQKLISSTASLLSWDQETKMPVKNTEFRSDQMAWISKLSHEKFIDKEFVKLVNELYEARETLEPIDKRSVEVTKRDLDKVIKIPVELVEEFSKTRSLAHEAWVDAKTKNQFVTFQPLLNKIIDLTIKIADHVDDSKPIYDVLIDDYEEGMTSAKIDSIFNPLKIELKELIKQIPEKQKTGAFAKINFDKNKAEKFIAEMVKTIGFDFERGAVGEVHHPFETSLSPTDVRINMSYYHKDIASSITGAVHELGHGLYEQNVDKKYHHTALSNGVSLGIHESQSRLLENMIARSKSFWVYFAQILPKYFPELKDISPEDIQNDLNIVKPSFIRIEADEVTYNLHIILRYEIEQLLLNKNIKLEELPEVWNAKMKDLLGIVPETDSVGCLQDVHWSMGGFGYFPTYTLGNLNAGQLWNKFTQDNTNFDSEVEKGDFKSYFNWFQQNIWQHGGFYKPLEVMINATGEDLDSKYLIEYLKKKYK